MKKNTLILLVTILILGLTLSACERPATRATVATPTAKGQIPFPVATQPQIVKDSQSLTQTAQAGGPSAGATSTAPFILPTRAATATQGILSTPVPTATRVVFASPTPGRPATYLLQSKETMYCLARRFDVDVADLLSLNNLTLDSATMLAIGTELKIPQSGSYTGDRVVHAHPDTYTVDPGDTIGFIACYYGDITPDAILAYNGLKAGATLSAGQVLQIP
jgi:LysM repeat protein